MKNFSIEKLESRKMCTVSDPGNYPDIANDTGYAPGMLQTEYGTLVQAMSYTVADTGAVTGGLQLQGGAVVKLRTGTDTLSLTDLSISKLSRLDIGTGRVIVSSNGFSESTIRSQIKSGLNGSNGIMSDAINSQSNMTIGYIVSTEIAAPSTPWGPAPYPNNGNLLMAYAAPGDTNLDGCVDLIDIVNITSAGKFGTGKYAKWEHGDTNYDGVVDLVDIVNITSNNLYNKASYLSVAAVAFASLENTKK